MHVVPNYHISFFLFVFKELLNQILDNEDNIDELRAVIDSLRRSDEYQQRESCTADEPGLKSEVIFHKVKSTFKS